ncbi:unnamed protein product [Protopolystoma xenopodis]|uniref:Uncharacterized protein n=1 Tax=Protopolystoma xenopodis TaxID=117903 RepID=A0A3S5AQ08_9PLAT|nr:unnamed protein product [Protopolystoma xenopodis]
MSALVKSGDQPPARATSSACGSWDPLAWTAACLVSVLAGAGATSAGTGLLLSTGDARLQLVPSSLPLIGAAERHFPFGAEADCFCLSNGLRASVSCEVGLVCSLLVHVCID